MTNSWDIAWAETIVEIAICSAIMDEIHERLPGKENRKQREIELIAPRKRCAAVIPERYALVKIKEQIGPIDIRTILQHPTVCKTTDS